MNSLNLSQANQALLQKRLTAATNPQQPTTNPQVNPKPEQKKNGKKMLALGAAAVAAAAIAAIAIYKGKSKKAVAALSDINFDKGVAKKGDKLFTGVVEDTLKSGDKVTVEYIDGVVQKSKITGSKNIEKVFTQNEAGERIVKTIENGTERTTNLNKLNTEVLADKEKFNKLLKDTTLSSKELQEQANGIKFKSKNQQKELENAIENRKNIETKLAQEKAKARAEKLAKEKAEAEKLAQAKAEAEVAAQKAAEEKARQAEIDYFISLKANAAQEAEKYAKDLKNKSDKELADTLNDIEKQLEVLTENRDRLRCYGDVSYVDIKYTSLDKEGKEKYFSLNEKRLKIEKEIDFRRIENSKKKYEYVANIISNSNDKPVKTEHTALYLNEKESKAFDDYIDIYQCNDHARAGRGLVGIDVISMDSAFEKAPALKDDAIVYRAVSVGSNGEHKNYIESIKEGVILENPGYTSTSTKPNTKQFYQFAGDVAEKETDGVLMRIHLPKGTKGLFGGSYEFLLNHDTRIKVNKINLIDGVKVADCEYILP